MTGEEIYFAKRRVLDKIVLRIPQVGLPYFLEQVITIVPEMSECTEEVSAALRTVKMVHTSIIENSWDREMVTTALKILIDSGAVQTIYKRVFSYEDVHTMLVIGCEQYLDTMNHVWEVSA